MKYKCSEIWNELPISMRSFPSISQFSNKFIIEAWVPARIFFRGAMPLLPFLSRPFPILYFLSLLPSPRCPPSLPSGPLKSNMWVWGGQYCRLAKISWCSLPSPAPFYPLLFPISLRSHSFPVQFLFPSLPPIPSSPLSFPVICGHVNRSYLLTYFPLNLS